MCLLSWVCMWACAMYNACSRIVVSCSALYAGSARKASCQSVVVYGRAPKTASLGSWDMYFLARSGRVRGLKCMPLLILKQLQSASYKVSGMGHGSSYSSYWFCFCCLCRSLFFVCVLSARILYR